MEAISLPFWGGLKARNNEPMAGQLGVLTFSGDEDNNAPVVDLSHAVHRVLGHLARCGLENGRSVV